MSKLTRVAGRRHSVPEFRLETIDMQNCSRRRLLLWGGTLALLASAPAASRAATQQQAQDMVAKAIADYDKKGEAAFADFNAGTAAGFRDGEVYIVVQSRGPGAKVLAHGADPKLVNMPLADIADPTGLKFGEEMSEKATAQGGWFDYQWPDPQTGKLGHKTSWAILHDNLVFIAGIYVR